MTKKCIGCGSILQYDDEKAEGYIKKSVYEKALYCERCFKIMHYGVSSVLDKNIDINEFLKKIDENIPVIYLLDLTCISKETLQPLKKIKNKKYIILTKRDLLPKSIKDKKLISYIKENCDNISEIYVISGKKLWNIEIIYNKLLKDKTKKCYVIGTTNSGKSTLINALLESIGEHSYITTSPVPNTTTELINIKLNNKLEIIDTPGFINENSIINFIDINKYKELLPKKEIKPKIYNLRPNFMIIIDNIIRIENTSDKNASLIFYLKNELKYKKMKITTSEELKKLNKKEYKLENNEDLVIEGLGFIKVPNYAQITIYIENVKIISKRNKMI